LPRLMTTSRLLLEQQRSAHLVSESQDVGPHEVLKSLPDHLLACSEWHALTGPRVCLVDVVNLCELLLQVLHCSAMSLPRSTWDCPTGTMSRLESLPTKLQRMQLTWPRCALLMLGRVWHDLCNITCFVPIALR
jgi:hypothetical protein